MELGIPKLIEIKLGQLSNGSVGPNPRFSAGPN